MKKFTLMLAAVMVAVMSFAQVPAVKSLVAPQQGNVLLSSVAAPRTIDTKTFKASARAASDYVVITEQPAGEVKTYLRAGNHYYTQGQSLYYGAQSGTIDIVWGENNKVYFKDIVSGLALGTWVEGTVSDDGTTVTVPLHQNLYYHQSYDACIALSLINYVAGTGFVADTEAESVTFSLADGVLSLQGTGFTSVSLGATWTDDGSFQNYGDYESVYTPYTPNLNLVELPDGLTPVEKPMTAKFFASASQTEQAAEVSATVKVAKDGDDVYFQGLVQELPDAWLKGTLADGVVTIPVTYVGVLNDQNIWVCGYSSAGPVEVKFVYDAEIDAYEVDGYLMLNPYELSLDVSNIAGYYQAMHIGDYHDVVTLPEGVQTVDLPYVINVYDGSNQSEATGNVKVGIDGNDVYVQGLVQELPSAWLKGTINENGQMVIPMGQFIGMGNYGSMFVVGDTEEEGVAGDVVFNYDSARNLFTLANNFYISGKSNEIYYYSAILAGSYFGYNCDEIWVAAQQGYQDTQEVTEITIGETITGTIDQGESTNAPKYYANGEALRMYAGHKFTISSEKKMAKIVFTFATNASLAQMRLTANVGEMANATASDHNATWTGENNEVVFSVPTATGSQARITKIQIYYFDYATTVVELPEGVETETYTFKGTDTYYNRDEVRDVKVGFKDNYVYIQGLSAYVPEAWVRGEAVVENPTGGEGAPKGAPEAVTTYEFPGWMLGTYQSFFGSADLVFSGATMTYDPAADQFTCDQYQSMAPGSTYFMDEYADVVITKVEEVEATPADPEITQVTLEGTSYPMMRYNIPVEDVDGNLLVSDKLSYVVYVKKAGVESELTLTTDIYTSLTEDMTEIPYNFTDDYDVYNNRLYFNQTAEEIATWEAVGIQSIYRGMDVEHRSNIFWWQFESTAINDVEAATEGEAFYFDMQGRKATADTQGILIKQVRDLNGNVIKTVKVINK